MHTICYLMDLSGYEFSTFVNQRMSKPKPGELLLDYTTGRAFDVPDDVLPCSVQVIVNGKITVLFCPFNFSEMMIRQKPNEEQVILEHRIVDLFSDCFLIRTNSSFFDEFSVGYGPLWYFDDHLIELFYCRLRQKDSKFWTILNDKPRKTEERILQRLH